MTSRCLCERLWDVNGRYFERIAEEAISSIFGDYRGLVYRSSEEQVEISA